MRGRLLLLFGWRSFGFPAPMAMPATATLERPVGIGHAVCGGRRAALDARALPVFGWAALRARSALARGILNRAWTAPLPAPGCPSGPFVLACGILPVSLEGRRGGRATSISRFVRRGERVCNRLDADCGICIWWFLNDVKLYFVL